MTKEILTVQEVADYLRLSRTTIWRWCTLKGITQYLDRCNNEGKLPAFKVGRG